MIRYEDFVLNLNETLNSMYEHFGEIPHPFVYKRLLGLMHSSPDIKEKPYSQQRINGTASVYKWMDKVPRSDQIKMTEICRDVLENLNYDF